MDTGNFLELKERLEKPSKIVIVTHKSPDGDAMGSSLAMYRLLTKQSHQVQVIIPNEDPSFLKWMPDRKAAMVYEYEPEKSGEIIAEADFIFCLDFNTLGRIDQMGEAVAAASAAKIMIDHHQQPDDFAIYMLSDTQACSTAQLVYEFMERMDWLMHLDAEIASCIYTGIVTDTGSFRFDSVTERTHLIVADLIRAGAKNAEIHSLLFDNNSESRLRLLGHCMNTMKIYPEYHTAVMHLSVEDKNTFGFKKGDTEGFVNYPLSMGAVVMSVFFIEYEEGIKISFRSKGKFSVNLFARTHFNGGGHTNAAGGHTTETKEEVLERLLSILPAYKKELSEND